MEKVSKSECHSSDRYNCEMNTDTLDWAEMAAMLSPIKPAPSETPAETAVATYKYSAKTVACLADMKIKESLFRAENQQRLIDLGYPGMAEHYFNEHRVLDVACTDCESLSTAALPTSELSADVLARIERNKKAAQDRLNAKNRLDEAKMSLSTVAPPTSELSADVLARIARNKKAAQDRLNAKNRPNGSIVTAVLQPLIPLTPEDIRKAELKRRTQAENEKAASVLRHLDKKQRITHLPPPMTLVEEIENDVPMSTQQIQYHFKVLGRGIKQEQI
jgi:hypothetical protein